MATREAIKSRINLIKNHVDSYQGLKSEDKNLIKTGLDTQLKQTLQQEVIYKSAAAFLVMIHENQLDLAEPWGKDLKQQISTLRQLLVFIYPESTPSNVEFEKLLTAQVIEAMKRNALEFFSHTENIPKETNKPPAKEMPSIDSATQLLKQSLTESIEKSSAMDTKIVQAIAFAYQIFTNVGLHY